MIQSLTVLVKPGSVTLRKLFQSAKNQWGLEGQPAVAYKQEAGTVEQCSFYLFWGGVGGTQVWSSKLLQP